MSSWLDLVLQVGEGNVERRGLLSSKVDIPPWYPNIQQVVLQGCITESTVEGLVSVHIQGIEAETLWQGPFALVPPGDHYCNSTPLARAVLAKCNGAQQVRELDISFSAPGTFWFRVLVAPPCPPSRL